MEVELSFPNPLFEMHEDKAIEEHLSYVDLLPMVVHVGLDPQGLGVSLVDSLQGEECYADLDDGRVVSPSVETSNVIKISFDLTHQLMNCAQPHHGVTLGEIFLAQDCGHGLMGVKDDRRSIPWEVPNQRGDRKDFVTFLHSHLISPFVFIQVDWREILRKKQYIIELLTLGETFLAKKTIRNFILAEDFQCCSNFSSFEVLAF